MTPPALPRDFKTHAEQRAEDELERETKRNQQLAELRSDVNPPEFRIRVWEQAHGLRLPLDPEHPILDVIAVSTRLTVAQIQEEQRLRAVCSAGGARG